jgi:prepilin-type N-terminal cleavage/methylation domain-containing protein
MAMCNSMTETNETESNEQGFTLLEVIVALVIVIFAMAALYQALDGGMRASITAQHQWRAVEEAESLLTELGRSLPLRDGVTTGEFASGERWTLRVEPFAPFKQDGPPPVVAGHFATVEITRAAGPPLRLRTLMLGVNP